MDMRAKDHEGGSMNVLDLGLTNQGSAAIGSLQQRYNLPWLFGFIGISFQIRGFSLRRLLPSSDMPCKLCVNTFLSVFVHAPKSSFMYCD
jgi:hypothetical protein